jgi:hypothetical protein
MILKIRRDIRSSRCTTGGKWKKSANRKVFIVLFGHLWVVELTAVLVAKFPLVPFDTGGKF